VKLPAASPYRPIPASRRSHNRDAVEGQCNPRGVKAQEEQFQPPSSRRCASHTASTSADTAYLNSIGARCAPPEIPMGISTTHTRESKLNHKTLVAAVAVAVAIVLACGTAGAQTAPATCDPSFANCSGTHQQADGEAPGVRSEEPATSEKDGANLSGSSDCRFNVCARRRLCKPGGIFTNMSCGWSIQRVTRACRRRRTSTARL